MKRTAVIFLQCIVVLISIAAGFGVYRWFEPAILVKSLEEVIGQKEIEQNPSRRFSCGKIAGEDIPHLMGTEELEGLKADGKDYREYEFITVVTDEIIGTNIYGRVPWVDPDTLGLRDYWREPERFSGTAPEATEGPAIRAEAYQEYYLVRLPDSSYVVAQLNPFYAQKVKRGEVTLPIGLVYGTSEEAYVYLEEICREYGVDPSYTLYMLDEEWGAKMHLSNFFIRAGAAILVYLVLGVGLFLTVEMLFKWMGEGKRNTRGRKLSA